MQSDLFSDAPVPWREDIVPGAVVLRAFALAEADDLLAALAPVIAAAPFRHLQTPGGQTMSVAMTNCGARGWVSDRRGYRYAPIDPASGLPWPPMPALLANLASRAATTTGFEGFAPDACLINRYAPGSRMGLHQDRDEADFSQPIVSVSLGLPAVFLFGGATRGARPLRLPLAHGDVVVWGGPARLFFHGIAPLQDGHHPATGACRLNLTFRRAT